MAPQNRYLSTDPNAGAEPPDSGTSRYLSTDPNAGSASPDQKAPADEERSLGGFLGNVVSSGANFVKNSVSGLNDVGQAVNAAFNPASVFTNPQTQAFIQRGSDAVRSIPEGQSIGGMVARGAKEYFSNRYGGAKQISDTLYTDPVGVAADASTVLSAGGTALEALPGRIGQVGRGLATMGAAVDPMAAGARVVGAVAPRVGRAVARVVEPGAVIAEQGDLFGAPSAIRATPTPGMGRTLRTLAAGTFGRHLGDPTGGIASAVAMQALESPAVRVSLARTAEGTGRVIGHTAQAADASSELLTRLAILAAMRDQPAGGQ